jgi:hypothetical protein|tara:strand:- start:2436 stop:3272 length:837 start_codon:yes stop_codon:yes gene_type:complete
MKYDFKISNITRESATVFVQELHYSKVMPKLTKHYLGCFLDGKLVGVLTLGWGTQPKATISKLFDDLDTNDYYEIGKMCMTEEMPRNSESQMLSAVIDWMKANLPEKKYLYTWADGIMGKPGYVYQAANFLYGGFIWTQIYISPDGEKIHPRSSKRLCEENVQFKLKREPDFFVGKKGERIYWLTQDFLDHKGISKIFGKQFRYIYPLNKGARKLLKKSNVEWVINGPKDCDLVWDKATRDGRLRLTEMPHVDGNVTDYNTKNVNAHNSGSGSLEAFL